MGSPFGPEHACLRDEQVLMAYAQNIQTNGVRNPHKGPNLRYSNSTIFVAPLVRDVAIQYKPKEFNGSFMNENIYRQVGSPEVDKAWEDLGVNCEYEVIIETQVVYLTISRSSWCYLIRRWSS